MESDDEILHRLAKNSSMEFESWPTLLPSVIARIETIAHTEFPVPNLPDPQAARTPVPRFHLPIPSSDPMAPPESSPSSQETDKENALPSSSVGITSAPTSSSRPLATLPQLLQPPIAPGSLPGPIARLLKEITSTLSNNFNRYPPHTIQRLAELVLEPKRHYRSLTAYLHALDRVVHVTSGNNIYPLPPAVPDMSQMSLLANGVGAAASGPASGGLQINTAAANSLGSDESLGGALLTPIPWLARRTNGGSEDGTGSSEDGSTSSPETTYSQPVVVQQQQQVAVPQPQQPPAQEPQPQLAPQPQIQSQPQSQSQPQPPRPSAPSPDTTSPPSHAPQIRTEQTETIEGPNGIGSIETVSVSVNGVPSTGAGAVLASRGVTQGELLRQEQRAGVVPLSQLVRQAQQQQQALAQAQGGATNAAEAEEERASNTAAADAAGGDDAAMADREDGGVGRAGGGAGKKEEGVDDDPPHARGPSQIDDVDTGPQAGSGGATHAAVGSTSSSGQPVVMMEGIDVEAAVGRKVVDGSHHHLPADERKTSPEKKEKELVPRSPKREAEGELEGLAGKKVKIGEGEGEGEEMKVETEKKEEEDREEEKPETDAEGDVVIKDPVPGPTAEVEGEGEKEEAAAKGETDA